MSAGLVRVLPDKEKAHSILKMVDSTLEMIGTIDAGRYPSNVLKEYYDVIRELIAVIALLDGYKTQGEGAHKKLIGYLAENIRNLPATRFRSSMICGTQETVLPTTGFS